MQLLQTPLVYRIFEKNSIDYIVRIQQNDIKITTGQDKSKQH